MLFRSEPEGSKFEVQMMNKENHVPCGNIVGSKGRWTKAGDDDIEDRKALNDP